MVDWIKCVQMHGPTNPKDISTSSLMWIRRLGIVTNRFSRVGSSIYIELTSVLFVLGRRLRRSTWMFAKQFGITWIVFWLAESPSDHYSTPLSMGGEFWWKEETFRPLKRNTQRTKIPVSSPTARQYFQWMVADWLLDTCAFFSSGRVISSSQRPLPDNTQHSHETNIHAPGGIRTHNLSRRKAEDLRLWSRGHRDRLMFRVTPSKMLPSTENETLD